MFDRVCCCWKRHQEMYFPEESTEFSSLFGDESIEFFDSKSHVIIRHVKQEDIRVFSTSFGGHVMKHEGAKKVN